MRGPTLSMDYPLATVLSRIEHNQKLARVILQQVLGYSEMFGIFQAVKRLLFESKLIIYLESALKTESTYACFKDFR